jgi:thiamine pyrophosphate-dependent acetolactate synthase large subunit-like protein
MGQFVQARHEEMATFQAVGSAKFSGRPAVCLATNPNSSTDGIPADRGSGR